MREYFFDHEIFWNDVILWALKHIYRAGGVHQHTFYAILESVERIPPKHRSLFLNVTITVKDGKTMTKNRRS